MSFKVILLKKKWQYILVQILSTEYLSYENLIIWQKIKLQLIHFADTNKHFKFDSDENLNPWLRIWTKFLDMGTKLKVEKTTVYLLFFSSIQFPGMEIRSFISHPKLLISWLQRLEKKMASRSRWWARAIFQLTELTIKANPSCFQCACTNAP